MTSTRLTLAALVVALSACALTPEQLRVAYHGANLVDAGTTLARDPACMSEGNPLLGNNPDDGKVLAFMALQGLIYEAIYRHIRDHDESDRKAFGWVFLGVKALAVGNNAYVLSKGCY